MAAKRAFRIFTLVLMGCLLLSALLHGVLMSMADSAEYRSWMKVQIVLQLFAVGLLWYVRQFRVWALVAFTTVSIPFMYINAVYVNYGNGPAHLVLVPLFWVVFGMCAFAVRREFLTNGRQQRQHDA